MSFFFLSFSSLVQCRKGNLIFIFCCRELDDEISADFGDEVCIKDEFLKPLLFGTNCLKYIEL